MKDVMHYQIYLKFVQRQLEEITQQFFIKNNTILKILAHSINTLLNYVLILMKILNKEYSKCVNILKNKGLILGSKSLPLFFL